MVRHPPSPGLTFGGPDVRAFAWAFVPEQAAAVQFTDRNGQTVWQRPANRLVVFPDTIDNNADGVCPCRFDAIDSEGSVIASVDLQTASYIDD